jgi:hypothetical protein
VAAASLTSRSFRLQKDKLKECAQPYGEITTSTSADLEQIRSLINKLQENNQVARALFLKPITVPELA